MKTYLSCLIYFVVSLQLKALQLPTIFTDHMVLQSGQKIPVWGEGNPGETINVLFADQSKSTTVDASGKWRVDLDPLEVSFEPSTLHAYTEEVEVIIKDVLVGEVWLCSGQSNMQWSLLKSENGHEVIAEADKPFIRLYNTPRKVSDDPLKVIKSSWKVCHPKTVKNFSAVAYYFGSKLQEELKVPVGLVLSAWGGTRIEPWTPPSGFEGIESLSEIYNSIGKKLPDPSESNENKTTPSPKHPKKISRSKERQSPTKLYNGMLHAHIPFAIKGAIWYQGESNHADGELYIDKTRALLNGWRKLWGYDFPFYFVQIAPFNYGKKNKQTPPGMLPEFWEAQANIVKKIPKTGMAVISDHATLDDIHPPNKLVPGTRLALLALANTYGKDIVSTGPVFKKMERSGELLKIHFDSSKGLATRDGKSPDWFEIAGEGGVFRKADARIVNESVFLESKNVPKPVAVRFAWDQLAVPNLINGAGLPASAFRAGDLSK